MTVRGDGGHRVLHRTCLTHPAPAADRCKRAGRGVPGQTVRDRQRPETAEIAVTVVDAWQGRGLGTVLLQRLSQRAAESGLRYFTAEILRTNKPMLGLLRQLGEADLTPHQDGTVRARVELTDLQEPVPVPGPGCLRTAPAETY